MGGNYPDGKCNCTTPTAATSSGASMSVSYVAVYEKGGNSTPSARPQASPSNAANAANTANTASPSVAGAPPASFWGSTAAIPKAKHVLEVKIINRTNGRYPDSEVYWSFNGTEKSIAQQQYIDLPANSSGRMYFYLGSPEQQVLRLHRVHGRRRLR